MITKQDINVARTKYAERIGYSLSPTTVLFDMDGVLYDSMKYHERSWLETAEVYGLPMSREDVYMFEGQTGPQTIDILTQRKYGRPATKDEVRAIYDLKTRLFTQYNDGVLIPNIKQVVDALSGLQRIIVTGSSQSSLLDKLQDNFPDTFCRERMVTGLDVTKGKPAPEPYLRGLDLAKAEPWQAIVIENAPQGVCAAHAARCFTIAVNTGPLPDKALWNEGADLVFPDMLSLLDALPHLLN